MESCEYTKCEIEKSGNVKFGKNLKCEMKLGNWNWEIGIWKCEKEM